MAKKLEFDDKAREAILLGVEKLSKAVKATLGPRGRNVVIERKWGPPLITKDGVTVAREIELKDAYEDMGAEMVKEVAGKANDMAGDGTTTATILAESIYKEGLKAMASGANPVKIKRGIDKAVKEVIKYIEDISIPCKTREQIVQVATIASNGDKEIGEIIADAIEKTGDDGVISVQPGTSINTELKMTEGMQFDQGYMAPQFVTNLQRLEAVLDNPYIFITDKVLATPQQIVPVVELVIQTGRPLLVIAENVVGTALGSLILNKMKGVFPSVAVKAPAIGEKRKALLGDIATVTGATVVSNDIGLDIKDITLEHLGEAKNIKVTKDETIIVDGSGEKEAIEGRITQIKNQIEETESDYDKGKLQERLAKLSSGIAVIEVGAATEVEMKEKKDRIEDSLNATQAAVEEGIVPGGGIALLRASERIEDMIVLDGESIGVRATMEALKKPCAQIATNAGEIGEAVVAKILEGKPGDEKLMPYGYDAETGKYVEMIDAGIIDPAKVVRAALQNAAGIASLMLTTQVLVADDPDDEEKYEGRR